MSPIPFLLLVACSLTFQDSAPQSRQTQRMEITLERLDGNVWKAVDPGFIFDANDRIRFRFRANFDGFLYVMNYGTSGNYSQLFPHEKTGLDNRIVSGVEYRIPATEAYIFRIAGPPGHDVIYWMASPLALASEDAGRVPPAPPKTKQPPKRLMPRCDDSIFRARGECIDSSAGLRNIPDSDELPDNLKGVLRMDSRELIIMRKEESSQISSPIPLAGPVIYQFLLAHK